MTTRLGIRPALIFLAVAWAACDGSPTAPRFVTLRLPVLNAPPVIKSLTTSLVTGVRTEVEQIVTVTAVVEDKETPISQLTFLWSASAGTISGSGPVATWRLAKGEVKTPIDVTIRLVVVESYQDVDAHGEPVAAENRVTQSTAPFRVHDSVAEVTKMTIDFLVVYFGNSNVSAEAALVDFSNSCPGKCFEWADVTNNRLNFRILSAQSQVTSVVFDGANHASIVAPTTIVNVVLATGRVESACFIGKLTGVFESGRWWLCDSNADSCGGSVPAPATMSITALMLHRGTSGETTPIRPLVDASQCPFKIGQQVPIAPSVHSPRGGRGGASE